MWLLSGTGFVSIVQKESDKEANTLTVRSRVKEDLVHFLDVCCSEAKIIQSEDTDYQFRAVVPRTLVRVGVAVLVEDINYSNFKDEIFNRYGYQRASIYALVWDALKDLQFWKAAMSPGAEKQIGKKPVVRDTERLKLLFTNSRPHIPGGKLANVAVRTTRSIIGERRRAQATSSACQK